MWFLTKDLQDQFHSIAQLEPGAKTTHIGPMPVEAPSTIAGHRARWRQELDIDGYSLEWGGEYEDSGDAQAALAGKMPMIFLAMVLVVICLFNSIGQPLVIFMTVPLALIGVTVGLLVTGQPFGFMALLGFLSLIGMIIKNGVVLVDEINLNLSAGKEPLDAIVESGASRLRPVAMAASTTALGMLPLIFDAFFVAMAWTIIFGLLFATVLTMAVLPVFYAILYRVPSE